MKQKPMIDPEQMRADYEKRLADLKEKHKKEFIQFREVELEKAILLVEERYKNFNWRGSAPFNTVRPNGGSCLFNGLEYCEVVYFENEGFLFSSNISTERVKLRDLPTKTVGLMIALIKYMK